MPFWKDLPFLRLLGSITAHCAIKTTQLCQLLLSGLSMLAISAPSKILIYNAFLVGAPFAFILFENVRIRSKKSDKVHRGTQSSEWQKMVCGFDQSSQRRNRSNPSKHKGIGSFLSETDSTCCEIRSPHCLAIPELSFCSVRCVLGILSSCLVPRC